MRGKGFEPMLMEPRAGLYLRGSTKREKNPQRGPLYEPNRDDIVDIQSPTLKIYSYCAKNQKIS